MLVYHAGAGWLPGGFLGVEVFFVISGYIITASLRTERRSRGSTDLPGFWRRRARRLLPALFLLLLGVLAYSLVFLRDELTSLRIDALAASGYVTNWYLIFDGQSYFETFERPSLLRHLWSLAIEEQFYLVWPLAFLVLCRLRPWLGAGIVLLGALGSAALMTILLQNGADPSRLYYGTDTRMAGLLIGAAAAFLWLPGHLPELGRGLVRAFLNLIGVAAVAGLVALHLLLDDGASILYRGGFLLTATLTAVVIVLAVHPRLRIRHLLGWQPLRWFGVRSYSIYLWHWPVFMVSQPHLDLALDGITLFALRLAITIVLAALSYQVVERPIRNGALGRVLDGLRAGLRTPAWRYRFGAAGLTAAVAGLGALVLAVGLVRPPGAPPPYGGLESLRIVSRSVDESASARSEIAVDTGSSAWSRDRLLGPERAAFVPGAPPLAEPTGDNGLSAWSDWWFDASLISSTIESTVQPTPGRSAEVAGLEATSAEMPPALEGAMPGTRVSAVGDSVMLGAATSLLRVFPDLDVDAEVGRQSSNLIDVLRQRTEADTLGEVVVIQAGNNGTVSVDQMDEILTLLQDVRRVVVVNVRLPRTWEESNNSIIAETVAKYPNAVLADWYEASKDNPDYFVRDRVHLRAEGAQAFAATILSAIQQP